MIKHVNGRGISRSHTVKDRPTYDLIGCLKPVLRKESKVLVI